MISGNFKKHSITSTKVCIGADIDIFLYNTTSLLLFKENDFAEYQRRCLIFPFNF
ncbi:hypothetical protein SAMN05216269_105177 [Flavobacterium xinjiangense]|uniref:Uncharacterized protein n=1 Tax=Flavobacterium xinjiangense TaxID=178356 RepID=A0A1M7K3S9_9FLAO|nr:hypothetical protein SAMN05216269_105177 [Flavobacterium xinjiangense]